MVTKPIPPDWYLSAFGQDYLERYPHRDEQEAFTQVDWIAQTLELKPEHQILDACCGAGRHLKALRQKGFRAFGFDLSEALLNRAGFFCARADQRWWPFPSGAFDVILVMFTSLGYFDSDRDNLRLFDEMSRCLKPGGQFLLDAVDLEMVKRNLIPESVRQLEQGVLEEKRYLRDNRVIKEIIFKTPQGSRQYIESVRLFRREEIKKICDDHQLQITRVDSGIPPATGRLVVSGFKS